MKRQNLSKFEKALLLTSVLPWTPLMIHAYGVDLQAGILGTHGKRRWWIGAEWMRYGEECPLLSRLQGPGRAWSYMTKFEGAICISVLYSKFWGKAPSVIYVHGYMPAKRFKIETHLAPHDTAMCLFLEDKFRGREFKWVHTLNECVKYRLGYNTVRSESYECIRANTHTQTLCFVNYLFHDFECSVWLFCLVWHVRVMIKVQYTSTNS